MNVVNETGINPVAKKLDAIVQFPPPTRAKDLLGFLGAVNYYRRCLPNVDGRSPADIMAPLYLVGTKKQPGKKFTDIWAENNLQEDFDRVKKMLMQACALSHPDPNKPLALTVDASKSSIGGSIE